MISKYFLYIVCCGFTGRFFYKYLNHVLWQNQVILFRYKSRENPTNTPQLSFIYVGNWPEKCLSPVGNFEKKIEVMRPLSLAAKESNKNVYIHSIDFGWLPFQFPRALPKFAQTLKLGHINAQRAQYWDNLGKMFYLTLFLTI